MNMKKVLAVVLAVMLAISAMAITAFAREEVLNLDAVETIKGAPTHSSVNFIVPVYAQYGYAIDGLTITFTLPANGTYVIVDENGVEYKLDTKGKNTDDGTVNKYAVTFGTLAHSWDGQTTIIPQSTIVGQNGELKLVATFPITVDGSGNRTYNVTAKNFDGKSGDATIGGATNYADKDIAPVENTIIAKAEASNTPNGSIGTSYCFNWAPTDAGDKYANDGKTFAEDEKLQWNATISNKGLIVGAESAYVRVVFDKAIVGNYYIALKAQFADGSWYEGGHNFTEWGASNYANKYVTVVPVEGATNVVDIPISKEALYNVGYGIFNMYLGIDVFTDVHDGVVNTIKDLVLAGNKEGSFGDYSWKGSDVFYNGEKVTSFTGTQNPGTANEAPGDIEKMIVSADLVLVYADEVEETPDTEVVPDVDDTVDVEAPVESTEEETEDVEAPAEEEKNPETGVAFALVPAVIALAVVAFKKR